MLTYEQSLDFIHGIARFGSKPGLRRVRMLLERMGNPQDRLKFIHVAGTDGKGSTCAMLSSIYTAAGYRTGLYISPYVVDFRERIQINGEMIPPEELAASTSAVKAHWDALDAMGETPSEFEVVVAVAMDYFLRQRCDLVILEVGMGGRFDATNIIRPPLCSVITHISLDHTQYLGDTIEKIAMEKCGIVKPGGVTVCYPKQEPAALAVIMRRCAEEGNSLHMALGAQVLQSGLDGSVFRYEDEWCGDAGLRVALPGEHQIWNAVTAIEAVKAVALRGFPVNSQQLAQGLAAARIPSRIEVLAEKPYIILDGGHNPAEAKALATTLAAVPGKPSIHAVIGMLEDKDVDACLRHTLPLCTSMTAVTPDYPRALTAGQLAEAAREYCSDVRCASDKHAALAEAYARCGPEDILLACGSLYLSAELRPILLDLVDEGIII